MARMRAVTEQLEMDIRGLRSDMPVAVWFEYDPVTRKRYDQIQFFANGVFQSSRQWDYTKADTTLGRLSWRAILHGFIMVRRII